VKGITAFLAEEISLGKIGREFLKYQADSEQKAQQKGDLIGIFSVAFVF